MNTVNSIIRSDEELTLETLALETLCDGQFTILTQMIKPNYLVISPIDVDSYFL